MKDTPLLMCGDMVRATLEDRKTQTRRVVTDPKLITLFNYIGGEAPEDANRLSVSFLRDVERTDETKTWRYTGLVVYSDEYPEEGAEEFTCPYGVPGDRLWVRETFQPRYGGIRDSGIRYINVGYRADGCGRDCDGPTVPVTERVMKFPLNNKWKPSIFMPRWASRITLEIVSVGVERVQDISEEDSQAEGVTLPPNPAPAEGYRFHFSNLWDSLNKERGFGWDTNPWVWVLTFKRI